MLSSPNLIRLTPCHLLWKAKIDLSPFDAAVIDADDCVGTVFKMLQHVLHKCGFCHFPSIPSVWMNKFLFNNKTTNIVCVIDVSTAAAKTFGHDFSVLKWQGPFDFNFGWIVWITQESPTTFPIYGRQTYVTSREQKKLVAKNRSKGRTFLFLIWSIVSTRRNSKFPNKFWNFSCLPMPTTLRLISFFIFHFLIIRMGRSFLANAVNYY